jgi:hypothetical protein
VKPWFTKEKWDKLAKDAIESLKAPIQKYSMASDQPAKN